MTMPITAMMPNPMTIPMNDVMLHLSIRKKWDCQVWRLSDIMRLLAEMIMLKILREGLMRLCRICPV